MKEEGEDDYENMFPESEIQFVNYYETKCS